MKWLQKCGVKGLKVDFFGSDKQQMMGLYEDILTDANEYGLMIIFHGCTIPRGWERMYPNYVGSEAVLASENLIFNQHFDDMEDGVDFIPLPTWKIFMIQFLNIAGLGPIFGAIMGAKFGTASYLWIVLGTIFAGAVHDYLSGMLSLRHNGESLPEIIGRYLGLPTKQLMRGFTVVLMILVGAVFVAGPAGLLAKLTPDYMDVTFWIIIVFIYYMLATLLPVDKIIGKIYPLFAIALLFMAVGILVMLYVKSPELPEMWDGFGTKYEKNPMT
jgi:carbon starvation protein CstA